MSFVYLGIHRNHHHLLRATSGVDGAILQAHLHPLFWEPLFALVTACLGGHSFARVPTAVYGLAVACLIPDRRLVST